MTTDGIDIDTPRIMPAYWPEERKRVKDEHDEGRTLSASAAVAVITAVTAFFATAPAVRAQAPGRADGTVVEETACPPRPAQTGLTGESLPSAAAVLPDQTAPRSGTATWTTAGVQVLVQWWRDPNWWTPHAWLQPFPFGSALTLWLRGAALLA